MKILTAEEESRARKEFDGCDTMAMTTAEAVWSMHVLYVEPL